MTAPRRATGTSLAAILLVATCVGAVMLLHFLRTDLDPVSEVMSSYANGPFGVVMTLAFYALGVGCLALGWRLRSALDGGRAAALVPLLVAVAGGGLVLAGVFEVELPGVPDTVEESVHSNASVVAFVLLVLAMILLAVACGRDPRWTTFRPVAIALAVTATLAAAASPLADRTPFTGVAQRVLGAAVVLWLVLVARRIRATAFGARPRRVARWLGR